MSTRVTLWPDGTTKEVWDDTNHRVDSWNEAGKWTGARPYTEAEIQALTDAQNALDHASQELADGLERLETILTVWPDRRQAFIDAETLPDLKAAVGAILGDHDFLVACIHYLGQLEANRK